MTLWNALRISFILLLLAAGVVLYVGIRSAFGTPDTAFAPMERAPVTVAAYALDAR